MSGAEVKANELTEGHHLSFSAIYQENWQSFVHAAILLVSFFCVRIDDKPVLPGAYGLPEKVSYGFVFFSGWCLATLKLQVPSSGFDQ